jgi:putative transcriptional regulator
MMRDDLFQELLENAKLASAWLRGEDVEPSRVIFVGEPDPRATRTKLGMTQEEFAETLGISVKTLRNWEQGRRVPSGPAERLLRLADMHADLLREDAAA